MGMNALRRKVQELPKEVLSALKNFDLPAIRVFTGEKPSTVEEVTCSGTYGLDMAIKDTDYSVVGSSSGPPLTLPKLENVRERAQRVVADHMADALDEVVFNTLLGKKTPANPYLPPDDDRELSPEEAFVRWCDHFFGALRALCGDEIPGTLNEIQFKALYDRFLETVKLREELDRSKTSRPAKTANPFNQKTKPYFPGPLIQGPHSERHVTLAGLTSEEIEEFEKFNKIEAQTKHYERQARHFADKIAAMQKMQPPPRRDDATDASRYERLFDDMFDIGRVPIVKTDPAS